MTTAETRVPSLEGNLNTIKGPEVWSPDSTTVFQDFVLPGVASPWKIQGIYLWTSYWVNRRIFIPYEREGTRTEEGGWAFRLNIWDDQQVVKDDIAWSLSTGQQPTGAPYGLTALGFQVRILDKNWDPPEGVFNPEVLAQPGALSNVNNGYGFFGSIGVYREEWNVEHMSLALGYPN